MRTRSFAWVVIGVCCGTLHSVSQPAPKPAGTHVPKATTAEGLYDEGSALRREGKPDAALATWRRLIETFPDSNRTGCAAIRSGVIAGSCIWCRSPVKVEMPLADIRRRGKRGTPVRPATCSRLLSG